MPRTVLSILFPIVLFSVAAQTQNQVVAPPGSDLGLPFSAGVISGDLLFLSGAIGNRPGSVEVEGDGPAQLRQTLDNLGAVLAAAEMDFSRVVEADIYLSDLRLVDPEMREVLLERFPEDRRPALTTVQADIAIPATSVTTRR